MEAIELHDSELAAVSRNGDEILVSLSRAYLHRSSGRPGVDAGTGWVQPATLTLEGATLICTSTVFPTWISDGHLRVGSEMHDNLIPAVGDFSGAVELSLVLAMGGTVVVQGHRFVIQLHGEAVFVESYDP